MTNFNASASSHNGHTAGALDTSSDADPLLCLLDLQPGARVLDVGCANAALAMHLLMMYPSVFVTGIGFDAANTGAFARARALVERLDMAERLTLIESTIATAGVEPGSFDAAVCIDASSTFGSYAEALRALTACVRPGGLVLVADEHWQHALHSERDVPHHLNTRFYPDHAGNLAAGEGADLVALYAIVGDDDVWSDHAPGYERAIERHVTARANDTSVLAARDRVHNLCRTYLRFGRETLGHGWYLFWRG